MRTFAPKRVSLIHKSIHIHGAKTHNLKNIDLKLPRDELVVITGLSGSGKSSLAFDTLYAEGQRRYVESLSAYARQFLSLMEKPEVDHIEGLSPAIAIEQKSTSHNPRSTVGTITEVYDYLRLLYARVGEPRCPVHQEALAAQTIPEMVDQVIQLEEGSAWMLLAPVVRSRKGEHVKLLDSLKAQGYVRFRIDGMMVGVDELEPLSANQHHSIDVVVDRFKIKDGIASRLAESFESALLLSEGLVEVAPYPEGDPSKSKWFSEKWACPKCDYSMPSLEPRLFSFNSPMGACPTCDGLGVSLTVDPSKVVEDPSLSLAQGAIRGWDRKHFYYYQLLQSLAEHFGFSLDCSFSDLSPNIVDLLFYGSGDEKITFSYLSPRRRRRVRVMAFEGIIANMNRRYHESETQSVRDDILKFMTVNPCSDCGGIRLNRTARHVYVADHSIGDVVSWSIEKALAFFQQLELEGNKAEIAEKILKEINDRLGFLVSVGLNYLSLSRRAETLSGGEAQRIRLASQIGSGLVGVMYILDEPTIGLHQRDNERLLATLKQLRDLGNTVIVIEHDEDAIRMADHIVDVGPGAGVHGGEVVAEGDLDAILEHPTSLTGQYLSGRVAIDIPKQRVKKDPKRLVRIKGADCHNLKSVDVTIPVGLMTCVTGVSGSGKSSLINQTLYSEAQSYCRIRNKDNKPKLDYVQGLEHFDQVIRIDQSPIGRTPRSNPATYTNLFGVIRELFAGTEEARSRGYKPGRFSFNVKGGRCEACQGAGLIKVEMHFLADVYVNCDQCKGKRYQRETLEILYKGKTISDVLDLTIEEACVFFESVPKVYKKLKTLMQVGLGYLTLGQSATTLSGGEAQRLKLSRELSKRDTGNTLYLLDEPTTGLHFHDIKQLLEIIHTLRDHGNTIVIIEHNLDVIKTADWIIDMGPEGGDGGGQLVAMGTPNEVVQEPASYTGRWLKPLLDQSKR